jgi:peptide-methionine (S)-S-oxide reductase
MNKIGIAVFGGGCFWCTEAVFKMIKGVNMVLPGYAGGSIENPTYEQVSLGNTGHAEVIYIEYDPTLVKYDDLLTVFFASHDPTTLNRQGNDVGTQYRSVIFYTTEEQAIIAQITSGKAEQVTRPSSRVQKGKRLSDRPHRRSRRFLRRSHREQ